MVGVGLVQIEWSLYKFMYSLFANVYTGNGEAGQVENCGNQLQEINLMRNAVECCQCLCRHSISL